MGVGGGSRGPSALRVGETTDGDVSFLRDEASSSDEPLDSSSQESATGLAAFLGFDADVDEVDFEVFVTIGREMSCTGPFSPRDSPRREDWSSELGSAMACRRAEPVSGVSVYIQDFEG